jgi:hypothetical protein
LPPRDTVSKSSQRREGVPLKSQKPATSEQTFTGGEDSVKEGASSIGLRGVELLTPRPTRIAMGATIFLIGILTGAGIAAWMMPPV